MRALDLKGQVFGELTAISHRTVNKKRGWDCICSCGKSKWVLTSQLTSGNTKTCGDSWHKQSIKVGDRFGKLVVREVYRNPKDRRFMAKMDCDCGGTKDNASFRNLQRGATTHCGCSPKKRKKILTEGEALRNALIRMYKGNSKAKGIPFELTTEECVKLFKGNCYLCGREPFRGFTKRGLEGEYVYSGIDRVDNTKGYVKGNVKSCCKPCNYLKSNSTLEEFLGHIKGIINHYYQ